jgi:hypothetical protein
MAMSETTVPDFNPATLPYKLNVEKYRHHPTDELHRFMCDITSKLPSVHFVADGRTYRHGDPKTDEFKVFNDTEEVGKIWGTTDYDSKDSKTVYIYNINSYRINNQRGQRNRKHTKHYKIALRTALEVFAPVPTNIIAEKIIERVSYRVGSLASSAASQAFYCVRGNEDVVLQYFKQIEDEGPMPLPQTLVTRLGKWQDKYANWRIAESVHEKLLKSDGMAVKLLANNAMIAVDLTNPKEVKQFTNSYDLPVEYQEKLAILKIMELNQPIEGIGVKVEDDKITYIYMSSGAIQTTC